MSKTIMVKAIEKRLKEQGMKFSKLLHSGGLFNNATYDVRTVYSFKDINELARQGFVIDEGVGIFLLNAFFGYKEVPETRVKKTKGKK